MLRSKMQSKCLTHNSSVLLFYTLYKHQKTFTFSDAFRGHRKATPGCNGLKMTSKHEYIFIKRSQVNAYHEIKSSLFESDLILYADFAESCKNEQQDAIQSAYFRNQCFSTLTACCFYKDLFLKRIP